MTALEIINEVQIRLRLPKSTTITDAHAQLLLSFLNEVQRVNTANAQPLAWRVYGRSGGSIIIELAPTPDAVYQIDAEIIKKPPKMSIAADVPLLDADTLILGATMLAKKEMGLDAQGDAAGFQAKLGLQSDTQGESNFGDVEAV